MSENQKSQSSEESFFNPWAVGGAVTAACCVGAAFVFAPATAVAATGAAITAAAHNPEILCETYCSFVGVPGCVCGQHHH